MRIQEKQEAEDERRENEQNQYLPRSLNEAEKDFLDSITKQREEEEDEVEEEVAKAFGEERSSLPGLVIRRADDRLHSLDEFSLAEPVFDNIFDNVVVMSSIEPEEQEDKPHEIHAEKRDLNDVYYYLMIHFY